jgi:hypothetical protein
MYVMGVSTDGFACVTRTRVAPSSRHEYALRERDLGHLSVTGLCHEQTRVRSLLTVLLPPRVNTLRVL